MLQQFLIYYAIMQHLNLSQAINYKDKIYNSSLLDKA